MWRSCRARERFQGGGNRMSAPENEEVRNQTAARMDVSQKKVGEQRSAGGQRSEEGGGR